MNWQPINYKGINDLEQEIVGQLNDYLNERENRLSAQILTLTDDHSVYPIHPGSPILPSESGNLKLTDIVDEFARRIRSGSVKTRIADEEKDRMLFMINNALWDYTEVLEGCVTELFQRVRQIGVDRWNPRLFDVLFEIKESLLHRIDVLQWVIQRLESPLEQLCKPEQKSKGWVKKWLSWSNPVLDPSLKKNLTETENALHTRYQAFNRRYDEYMHTRFKVDQILDEQPSLLILSQLDFADQSLFRNLYRLLYTLDFFPDVKDQMSAELVRSLKSLASIDEMQSVFRIYEGKIRDEFYKNCRDLKELDQDNPSTEQKIARILDKVRVDQQELQQLVKTISRYRAFLLKHDPNPYIRSRLGFTEWPVGPEPAATKDLLKIVEVSEELNRCFSRLIQSLSADRAKEVALELAAQTECQNLLHEMSQPLISRAMMENRAEKLVEELDACNEAGSLSEESVRFVGDVLGKSMRLDWKYHVLHSFPLFHSLFRLHLGLTSRVDDPSHAFRIDRFNHLCNQVEEWVKKGDLYSHIHEVGLDLNDMKVYLQDFLATLQRVVKDRSSDPFLDETTDKLSRQLLEYRYLFGKFLRDILGKDEDGPLHRNQFLFVDQYFDSAERLLNELRTEYI